MISIPVLRTLGGCGGTIVSRAISASTGAFILSETNPRSAGLFDGLLNPLAPVRRRLPGAVPDSFAGTPANDLIDAFTFGQFVLQLRERLCDRALVIRDYNYVDFFGVPFIEQNLGQPSLDVALSDRGCTIVSVLLVRHPVDNLASLLTHEILQGALTAEIFVRGCLQFFAVFRDLPRIKFEDFNDDNDASLVAACRAWGLPFDPGWRARLAEVEGLTGHARAQSSDAICPPQRDHPHTPFVRAELERHPQYRDLLKIAGYV
jgi:hypothetical protein